MKLFSRAKQTPSEGRRARQLDTKNAVTTVRRSSVLSHQNNGKTFLRNRTLTGIMSQEIGESSEGSRAHLHMLHRQRRITRGLVLICLLIAALIGFLLSNRLIVSDIIVQDNGVSFAEKDKTQMKEAFNDYLAQHPTQLFMVTLQTEDFLRELQAVHPEIKAAYFQSELFGLKHTLKLSLREPLLEWNVAAKKYYVDSLGVAYEKNYFKAPRVSVEDQSGVAFSDSNAIPRRLIAYIGQLTGALQTNNIGVVTRIVIPASSREVDVYLEGRDYAIKTHIDREAFETAGDIKSAFGYLDQKAIRPSYIDVRVEGKAFYK